MNLHKYSIYQVMLLPLLLAIILYSNTYSHGYALDDMMVAYQNAFVQNGLNGIWDIFTHDSFVGFFGEEGAKLIAGGRYRPLSIVSLAIEHHFWPNNPSISHIINILLFSFTCFLCSIFTYLVLIEIFETSSEYALWVALILGLLFAAHPIHTEAVANIKGRDEVMSMLFGIGAMVYFLKNIDNQHIKHFLIAGFLFFLSLMSKENSITLLAIFGWIYWQLSKKKSLDKKWLVSFGLSALLFLALRAKFTHTSLSYYQSEILNNPFAYANFSQKWGTIFYSWGYYLFLLINPDPLTHDYYYNHIPYKQLSEPLPIIILILVVVIFLALLKNFKQPKLWFFGVFFFVATFSIVSNAFFNVGIIMNERFVFMPSYGFLWLASIGIARLILDKNKLYGIFLLIALVSFSKKTISRNLAWENNLTLFGTDVKTSKNSAKVCTSYGGVLQEVADTTLNLTRKDSLYSLSRYWLNKASQIYPNNKHTWLLLGNLDFSQHKNYIGAISNYQKALKVSNYRFYEALSNSAEAYFQLGKIDSAEYFTNLALQTGKATKSDSNRLISIYTKLGKTDALKGIENSGSDIDILIKIAEEAKLAGNFNLVAEYAEKILLLSPKHPEGLYFKGIALARGQNNLAEAIPFLEKAVKANTNKIGWKEDLAVAYGMLGRIKETIPLLESAAKAKPTDANTLRNLATSYALLGNTQKANELNQKAYNLSQKAQ